MHETIVHLCLRCVFAREVWGMVSWWSGGWIRVPEQNVSVELWWNSSLQGLARRDQRCVADVLIYIVWNIWNGRNKRIFEGIAALPARVFQLIKEQMKLRRDAYRGLELDWFFKC